MSAVAAQLPHGPERDEYLGKAASPDRSVFRVAPNKQGRLGRRSLLLICPDRYPGLQPLACDMQAARSNDMPGTAARKDYVLAIMFGPGAFFVVVISDHDGPNLQSLKSLHTVAQRIG
jgi:hypothetical protein